MREVVEIFIEEVRAKKVRPAPEAKQHAFATYITSFLGGATPSASRHYAAKVRMLEWLHAELTEQCPTLPDATRMMVSARHAVAFVNGVWKAWCAEIHEDVCSAEHARSSIVEVRDLCFSAEQLLRQTRCAYSTRILAVYCELRDRYAACPVDVVVGSPEARQVRDAVVTMVSEGLSTYRNNFEVPFFDAAGTYFQTNDFSKLSLEGKWALFSREQAIVASLLHETSVAPFLSMIFPLIFAPADDVFAACGRTLSEMLMAQSPEAQLFYVGHKARPGAFAKFVAAFESFATDRLKQWEPGCEEFFAEADRLVCVVLRQLSNDCSLRSCVTTCVVQVLGRNPAAPRTVAKLIGEQLRGGALDVERARDAMLRPLAKACSDHDAVLHAFTSGLLTRCLDGAALHKADAEAALADALSATFGRARMHSLRRLVQDAQASAAVIERVRWEDAAAASGTQRGAQHVVARSLLCLSTFTLSDLGWRCGSLPECLNQSAAQLARAYKTAAPLGDKRILQWVPMYSTVVADWHHARGTTPLLLSAKHLHLLLAVADGIFGHAAATVAELASFTHLDITTTQRVLEDLVVGGVLDLDGNRVSVRLEGPEHRGAVSINILGRPCLKQRNAAVVAGSASGGRPNAMQRRWAIEAAVVRSLKASPNGVMSVVQLLDSLNATSNPHKATAGATLSDVRAAADRLASRDFVVLSSSSDEVRYKP